MKSQLERRSNRLGNWVWVAGALVVLALGGVSCLRSDGHGNALPDGGDPDQSGGNDETSPGLDVASDYDGHGTPGLVVKAGSVQEELVLESTGGAALKLNKGTLIQIETEDDLVNPSDSDVLELILEDAAGGTALPDGVAEILRAEVKVKLNGTEVKAHFFAENEDSEGLVLSLEIGPDSLADGAVGALYEVSSDEAVRVGAAIWQESAQPTPTPDAGKEDSMKDRKADSASGGTSMRFPVPASGKYAVGGAGGSGSGSAPQGAFWAKYTVVDPGCVDLGTTEICGPVKIAVVNVLEESTKEWLGACTFGDSDTASFQGSYGYQFWCQRTAFDEATGSATITVSSPQANLPKVEWKLVRIEDGQPMYFGYQQADEGLHTPDGGVQSDPYAKKEWQFAGYKKLVFESKTKKYYDMKHKALNPLKEAGLNAQLMKFETLPSGSTRLTVAVYDTLDGSAKLGDIGKQNNWRVREIKGNTGTFDDKGGFKGTAHAVMTFPGQPTKKIWEISADVEFEEDNGPATPGGTRFNIKSGEITQTMYTSMPPCQGNPETFVDTYDIFPDDGYMYVSLDGDTLKYSAGASISSKTPLSSKQYQMCCPGSPCEDETMEKNEQEHEWLNTGPGQQTADSEGNLTGTYVGSMGTTTFTWSFQPLKDQ